MTRVFNLLQKRKYQEEDDAAAAAAAAKAETDRLAAEAAAAAASDKDKVSDKEAELLKEVMKRKGNEQTLKGEVGTLKEQLAKFEGVDVEQVRALLQDKTDRERAELEKKGEFDRVKQQIVEQHQTELTGVRTTFESQVTDLSGKLNAATSLISDLTIGRSFGDSPFVREDLALTPSKARVVYGSHFELQDGNVVAYDKPAGAANRTVLVDAKGDALPFDQAIQKIVKADPDYEHLIRSKVRQGAGSKNDPGTKATTKVGTGRDRISAAMSAGALNLSH